MIVWPLPEDAVKNQKPDVGDDLYECGIVVPVANLVPSTRVHVTEDGIEIGSAPVAKPSHPVITSPLHAGGQVSAHAIACEGTGHEIAGPSADPISVKAAPVPTAPPGVDKASLIVGNDTVTLTGLLVGSVHIVNASAERRFGRLAVALVSSRLEAKAFVERSFEETAVSATLDPGETITIPFAFSLPATLEPGHDLYARATIDQQTIVLHQVRAPPEVALEIELPEELIEGGEASVRAVVQNRGEGILGNVRVEIGTPFALQVGERPFVRLGDLRAGEAREMSWTLRAIAALASGSVRISAATDNGDGLIARRHIAVEGQPVELRAQPVLALPE